MGAEGSGAGGIGASDSKTPNHEDIPPALSGTPETALPERIFADESSPDH